MEPLPPIPPDAQLTKEFNALLETLGIPDGLKTDMLAYPKDKKWLLICQNKEKAKTAKMGPKEFVAKLQEGKVKSTTIAHLASSLNGEPKAWAQEFLAEGGLQLLITLLGKLADKEEKKPKDLDDITQIILSFKGLMKSHEGIKTVAEAEGSIETILKAELVVSHRTRISLLGMLSVFCVLSAKTHAQVLSLWKNRKELVDNITEGGMDLKTACLTFLNAAISAEGHDLEEERNLVFEDLKAQGLFKAIESVHELPSISEALDTQLDIFEEAHDIDMTSIVPRKTPEELFKILRDMMRQTTVYDDLGRVLTHLQNVRRNGQTGKISWDLIDSFIQTTADCLAKDGPTKGQALRTICMQMVTQIDPEGGSVSFGGGISPNGIPAPPVGGPDGVPPPPGGGPPPPPPPPGGGPPPPPPPPGGGPPPPPPPPGGGPPPPPPPPGGGPPPPPPPPGGGPPGPPPPPGMGGGPPPPPGGGPPPPALPKKRKIIPGQKMRNFNWNMINVRKIKDTIWEEIDDEKVRLDIPALEESFAIREKVKSEQGEDGGALSERNKKVLIQVLDSKRSQNVSIMLSRFGGISFDEIKKGIINLDEKVINLENLQAMIPFMPLPEEIEQLKEHVGTPLTDMGKAEAFFLTIMNIPLLTLKLKSWDFMRSFEVRYGALEESVTILETARRETRGSKKLKSIMEYVLAVGNYMNGSTNRGECFGFKLDSLNKMLDVKSSADPKVTMMHWIQTQIENKMPAAADLLNDFSQLETAPRQNVPTLQGDIGRLKGELNVVINLQKNPALEEGKMKKALAEFVPHAETVVEKLVARMETVIKDIKELLTYFGEDPKTEADEFFGQVASFVLAFDKAKKDTIRRKALEEKTALAEARKLKAAEERKAKKAAGTGTEAPNALENMLSELETGAAFSRHAANARKAREFGGPEGEGGLKPPVPGAFKLPTLRKVSRPDPPQDVDSSVAPGEGIPSPRNLRPTTGGVNTKAVAENASSAPVPPGPSSLRPAAKSVGSDGRKAAGTTATTPKTATGGGEADHQHHNTAKPPVPPKPGHSKSTNGSAEEPSTPASTELVSTAETSEASGSASTSPTGSRKKKAKKAKEAADDATASSSNPGTPKTPKAAKAAKDKAKKDKEKEKERIKQEKKEKEKEKAKEKEKKKKK